MLIGLLIGAFTLLPPASSNGQTDQGQAAEAAEPTGVELPGLRTATSDTYKLPSGALQAEIFTAPVNYETPEGSFKPIDEGLEEAPGGGITNGANSFDLHLPEQMGDGAVRLSDEGEWLSYRLLGEETAAAEVDGPTATYDGGNGSSFELHSLADGLKEEITLENPLAPKLYRYELTFSQGLVPSLQEDGSIQVKDRGGEVFATLPAPTISDATGAPPASAVHYGLQEGSESGHWILAVEADEAWLSDPARVWPVRIDPPAILYSDRDCTIGSVPLPKGWSKCGSSGATELGAGYVQSESQPIRTFLHFGVGSLPEHAYVSNATLNLYAPKAAENTVPGLETRRVTQDWTTALNWEQFKNNNFVTPYKWTTPGGDFTSEGHAEVLTANRGSGAGEWKFTSSGLRELVEGWVEKAALNNLGGGIANQGLVVKQIDETRTAECVANSANCPRRYVGFNSSAAVSHKPELDLTYFSKAPASNKMVSPKEGTATARRLMLKAAWDEGTGVNGVSFQYRAGKKGPFNTIPPSLLRNAKGEAVEKIAINTVCCQTEPLYFDAAHINSELQSKGGVVQVRALFEGGSGAGYTDPVEAKVDRYIGGPKDETVQVGPGSLDLLTGNLALGASDVAIGGFNPLSFSRSYNTRDPGSLGETTVLGRGWKSGAETAGGSEWASIKLTERHEAIEGNEYTFRYATLRGVDGKEIGFEKFEPEPNHPIFETPPDITGYRLVLSEGKFTLTDPGGNKTTFSNENSGNELEYLPSLVTQPGSGPHSTVMTWKFENNQRRLVSEVAPTANVSPSECAEKPTEKAGCNTLQFTYVSATTWGAPSSYGERLQKITYYGPGANGVEVARYAYDTQGRLVSEYDPRISPNLTTTYTYEGEKLRKVTPPGQEPWVFEYTPALDGESSTVSRLKTMKRSNLQGGETKTSIRYEVPLSGGSAPYQMDGGSVGAWGQTDIPTDATAIFPPTQVPAEPASSYEKATLYYMDAEGFGVNVATPAGAGTSGPSISTAETDQFGNVTRELTPQNRLRALAEPEAERVERSHLLETKFVYSGDGTELVKELGPLHQVKLQETGEVVQARLQRTLAYGNPENLDPAPLLPTSELTEASIPNRIGQFDRRETVTEYNWKLRAPIETVVDKGIGLLNIRRKTSYNETTGLPTEVRQPKASEEGGNVPGATKTIYYGETSSLDSDCMFNVKWAGLPCKVKPAAQPGAEGPAMPVTWIKSYSPYGRPTEIVEETPGAGEAGTRTTYFTYDAAGRQTLKQTTGGGQAVPRVETRYSATNGMPTTQRFLCGVVEELTSGCAEGFDRQETTTEYDALGRVKAYKDADGNKAETTYDSFGRPSTVSDGKGSQTVHYDSVTGLPTELTDSGVGTFTAAFDADGNMVKRTMPNGITAETTLDPSGAAVGLSYTKAASCGASCTWLHFSLEDSIYGQPLSEEGTLGAHQYGYDRAGRLIEAKETPTGGSCITRNYSYDKDSNRLSMTTVLSSLGSGCGTGSASEKKYGYDKADRLIDSGVAYDNFGRITKLPSADAGGNELTTSYFSTDMVATQTQAGITNSFELDASLRQRSRLQGGGLEGTEIFHYDSGGDSSSWTERGSTWTRNISGIGGELVAVQESGREAIFDLTNLHGDVVASAEASATSTKLKASFGYDEFGNIVSGNPGRFGWLGGIQRRTELPSGVIQMGERSYAPTIGRFLSGDPVKGGSANPYDYANGDPISGFDPLGRSPSDSDCDPGFSGCQCKLWAHLAKASKKGMLYLTVVRKCNRYGGITLQGLASQWYKRGPNSGGWHDIPPPGQVPTIEPACTQINAPCQNDQRSETLYYCEGGKEYRFDLTWGYVYNLRGEGAEHYLNISVDQTCPQIDGL